MLLITSRSTEVRSMVSWLLLIKPLVELAELSASTTERELSSFTKSKLTASSTDGLLK